MFLRSSALNDTNCQSLALLCLTWSTAFASPIPGSSHIPLLLCSTPHPRASLQAFSLQYPNTLTALGSLFLPTHKMPTVHYLLSLLLFFEPLAPTELLIQGRAPCLIKSMHTFLIQLPWERYSAGNLNSIFS